MGEKKKKAGNSFIAVQALLLVGEETRKSPEKIFLWNEYYLL